MNISMHNLQREIFLPSNERLSAFMCVNKPSKKKKTILCAAVTSSKPVQTYIYEVKIVEKTELTYKKKMQWKLCHLKRFTLKENNSFETIFDKTFKWTAEGRSDLIRFVKCLYTLSQKYIVQKPMFVNFPEGTFEGIAEEESSADLRSTETGNFPTNNIDDAWKALSEIEEVAISELLLNDCESAISNAENFALKLSRELSQLDSENIHSIMNCQDKVDELMKVLETAIGEVSRVEDSLDQYDMKLKGVKESMEYMKTKDANMQIRSHNNRILKDDLRKLVLSMDMKPEDVSFLLESNLVTAKGIQQCSSAAYNLQCCILANLDPSLEEMDCVKTQREKFNDLKNKFKLKLTRHLNNVFIHQANEGTQLNHCETLMKHQRFHNELLPYCKLMLWLKEMDAEAFTQISKVYTENIHRLYDHEIRLFIESCKTLACPNKLDKKVLGASLMRDTPFRRSTRSLHSSTESICASGTRHLDQIFQRLLDEISPYYRAEQDFIIEFFNMQDEYLISSSPQKPGSNETPKMNIKIIKMMSEVMPTADLELNSLIDLFYKNNAMNALYMYISMGQKLKIASNQNSYISKTFGNCLVQIKRHFDNLIISQLTHITESKLSKKSKPGILPFVHNFEVFLEQSEKIFEGFDRRTDLNKAYDNILKCIYKQLNVLSETCSGKVTAIVLLMENHHHITSMLSKLKIESLDPYKKESKTLYNEYLNRYVIAILGKPMQKLHAFLEGIRNRIATGVKSEEISFQLDFSKQELRKVINEYPSKEVKKGLEQLYKKLDKHLCEQENLLQVVWHSLQNEFLRQYKDYDSLIMKCYQAGDIKMLFSIKDLLEFFSDYAQSH